MTTRLATQFDHPHRPDLLVATPSCCSCCCCLVSTATMATLTAVYVHDAAVAAEEPRGRRIRHTVAAAAVGPVALWIAPLAAMVVARLVRPEPGGPWHAWQVLLTVVGGLVVVAAWVGALAWLYRVVDHPRPLRPAGWIAAGTVVAVAVELFTAGFFLYGQLAVLVVPAAGIAFNRRLRQIRGDPARRGFQSWM